MRKTDRNPVWVLHGNTRGSLSCSITEESALWFVTVNYGHETMLQESYPNAETATLRASALMDAMIASGWKRAQPPLRRASGT